MRKIIIVDKDNEYRKQLSQFINKTDTLKLVAEVDDGTKFLDLLPATSADIVIMDISLSEMNGIELIRKTLQANSKILILVHPKIGSSNEYFNIIQAGAKGCVSKNKNFQGLNMAIEKISSGEYFFSMDILTRAASDIHFLIEQYSKGNKEIEAFSKEEKDVLNLMSNSYLNADIAQSLKISISDVENIQKHLLLKTETNNTVSLMMFAIKNKLF